MSTASSTQVNCSVNDKDDESLEIFSIIWLDKDVRVRVNQDIQQKLRCIINQLKIFDDVEECKQYIEHRSKYDRLVLIVSDELSRQFIHLIHELLQVSTIYVRSRDKTNGQQWTQNFIKVRIISEELEELIAEVKEDHKKQMKVEEPLPTNMFSFDEGRSTTEINGHFAFAQLLTDCLLRLESTEMDRKELISCLEKEYAGNPSELDKLREFQKKHTAENTMHWYTRDSFFYRTLNGALRKNNIHMILLYRPFIADIYHQLKKFQCLNRVEVYRSQLMSIDEINNLKKYIGDFISINSFLSTSTKYKVANLYKGSGSQKINLERVLFEIKADPKVSSAKPFGSISKISQFNEECEVLFMLGAIFHLKSTNLGEDKVWTVKMSLCDDKEHKLWKVLADMKKKIGFECTTLGTLGRLLWRMGKLDLAEQYYTRFLKELSPDDPSIISVYADLADIASLQGYYDKKKLEGFLQISDQDLKLDDEIGCGGFGVVYRAQWLSRHDIVAVKRLHLNRLNPQAEKEFFKELLVMNGIRYPNIVTLYGACVEKEKYAIVMEYMSLGSLYKILHQNKLSLDWCDRLSIALQAAKGINYLHQLEQPMLHRDIKSLNFLLERSHEGYIVKVCDFGLAKTRNETTRQTQLTHAFAGTLQWSASEILLLEKHTEKSDIYSLGVVYWELATNEIPYSGHQNTVIREFVISGNRLKILDAAPSRFSALINECWAHNANDRPTCSHVIEEIQECINGKMISKIPANVQWVQSGVTVAGGQRSGDSTDKLFCPYGLFLDDDDQNDDYR
ncbi:unnamed protein product [Rotaria magnacalcarata]